MSAKLTSKAWAVALTFVLVAALVCVSGGADATDGQHQGERDDDYQQLLARCRAAFGVFDYQGLVALRGEVEEFLQRANLLGGDAGVTASDAAAEHVELLRVYKKLSLYLDFYRLNILAKGVSLLDWNYYRLTFDAIAAVDLRRVEAVRVPRRDNNRYYELLYQEAVKSLRYAASYYRHYFPFIDWTLATEGYEFDAQQGEQGWESLELLMVALEQEVGKLNYQHAKVRAARKVSAANLHRAQRELLQSYDSLMDTPFRVILTSHISRANATAWRELTLPSAASMRRTLLAINRMFEERLAMLQEMYETQPLEDFALFLINNQSQTFAEFMVNYPEFFSINNYHLDLIDVRYQRQVPTVPLMHYVALVSSIFGVTLATLHEVSTPKTTSLLYFFSVFGGLGATVYLAAVDKSLARVLPLRKQLHDLRVSILLGQSDAYRYYISRNGGYRHVRNKALVQSVLFGSYAALIMRGVAQLKTSKLVGDLDDPISTYRQILARVKRPIFRKMDMADIDAVMKANSHPERLAFTERMQILDGLFKHRHQAYTQWRKNLSNIQNAQDLSVEQIKALNAIGEEIANKFDPLDAKTIQRFMQRMEVDERIATLNLERIRNYLLKIFQVQRRPYVQTF
ncbi:MAG: hypothetical protein OYH77_05015 [Pseudomonadota bacterium]|nr:hypothetical protein [Pseudomonadota bacterium]